MPYAPSLSTLLGLASGLAVLALGLAVLTIRPRRPSTLSFSALASLWGLAIAAANVGTMATDAESGIFWYRTFTLLYIPLYVAVAWFLLSFPRPRASPLLLALIALPALGLLVAFFAAPDLFARAVIASGSSTVSAVRGPLGPLVIEANSLVAFAVALGVLGVRLLRSPRGQLQSQLALVCAGLLLYVSYRGADLGHSRILAGLGGGGALLTDSLAPLLASLSCLAATLFVAISVWRRRDLPWRDLLLACAFVPFGVALAELLVAATGAGTFSSVGLWRLGTVALLAYAMARQRLFDVELRLRAASPALAYVGAAFLGLVLVAAIGGAALVRDPGLGATAGLGVLLLAVPARHLGPYLGDKLSPLAREPDYVLHRQAQVAQAAREEASTPRRGGGATFGKFRILRELGRGSGGHALLAEDPVLRRLVVIKQPVGGATLTPQARELFLQEARLTAMVQHPNVVTVFDALDDPAGPAIVLEHVEGGSLDKLLRGGKRMEPERALTLMREVLSGLEAIHGAGILHRDLKPANVLVDKKGVAKITDFGVARPPATGTEGDVLARAGFQPGSLAYMSPEQARGDTLDERSDVYAASAILYRLLSGRHYIPLSNVTPDEARRRIETLPPELPAGGIPAEIGAALERGLAKRAEDRPASASELRALLMLVTPTQRDAPEFAPDEDVPDATRMGA